MRPWLDRIRADTAAGKTYRRVRMVTDPLTDYLRFELGVTDYNIAAGEQIRVLTDAQVVELWLPRQDFLAVRRHPSRGDAHRRARPVRRCRPRHRIGRAEFSRNPRRGVADAVPFEEYASRR
ncbi:hypothetical protein [Alloactinosynnema sp. L-07]|nr:hypothetical protein [Alloactinosynnema sp. L-07]